MAHGPDAPARRLEERLRAARRRAFVGRAAELDLFRAALDAPAARIFVHGPGGIGKSTLLRRLADEARAAGRPVVWVDGRSVEPSPSGFSAAAALPPGATGAVLLVDTFERCQGLEGWLRDRFLPGLPDGVLAVVAGRRAPDAAWAERGDVVALGDLSPEDATRMLSLRGVPSGSREALLGFAGGHPLALSLAAEVAVAGDVGPDGWAPTRDVIATLLARLVGEVPSPAHRQALEVCAHARTTTVELLGAVLDVDPVPIFAWLRELPFVSSGRYGAYPHDVVREALDTDLRWRDPEGYRAMSARIRAHLVERVDAAAGSDALLPALAAVHYLHRQGGFAADFMTWNGDGAAFEDEYRDGDREAVLRLAPEELRGLVEYWLDEAPTAFHVYRHSGTDEAVGFMAWLRLHQSRVDIPTGDPVVDAAWEHARRVAPLGRGEHLAVARFLVYPPAYQRPSPVMDLMLMRIVAEFIQGERLGWSFLAFEPDFWAPLMAHALHDPIGGTLFAHDWRAMPVRDWLSSTIAIELDGTRALRDAGRVALSRSEFDGAVRVALRSWRSAPALAASPLRRSRLVDGAPDPVEALRGLLVEATDSLRAAPRDARLHRAVVAAYFQGAATQEEAAERAGVPFGTFRRHLAAGVDRVTDWLWRRETG
ncbi:hypothetical protein Val02_75590 [Virgisporangium aliadipatigenens]|uniref:Orc1-like AAA ATPase domain-containing protein n=1 Tax=Virgisporangium aliadipatigenens TaxID=741659 RepID=A0A8J3YUE1_9ACTN|nr:ATP-binding protein [Virgisporangium aliadipatigenens]GIJ50673.1 hypothetical protein Val02_75590 [Virgisporangium aliadipatigenens]